MFCCLIIKPFILSTSFHIGVEAQCIVQDPILRAALRHSVGWGEDEGRRQGKGTLAFSCHLSVSVPVETSLIWLVSSLKAIFSPCLTTGSSRLAFSKVPLCPSQLYFYLIWIGESYKSCDLPGRKIQPSSSKSLYLSAEGSTSFTAPQNWPKGWRWATGLLLRHK